MGHRNEQDEAWDRLYERVRQVLQQFGSEGIARTADCWVDDDDIGTQQQKIYVRNLRMLKPDVVLSLQQLLGEFPGWEIMAAVSVPVQGAPWPDMGLTIRQHEIVDGLRRAYFPREFQAMRYPGSRPGTDRD